MVVLAEATESAQYAISVPWLHENPSDMLMIATIIPNAVTSVPNVAMMMGMIFLFDKMGSSLNFMTHTGGIMKASGDATITP